MPMPECRFCGCIEFDPCIDPIDGTPCRWVEPDLCSICADLPAALRAEAIFL